MLTQLRLREFRIFSELVFEPDAGANFIVGCNAHGKTSLLEAACLLLRLQSPRTNSPSECVRFGERGFAIDGRHSGRHLALKFENRLKHFVLDSKPQAAASDYLAVARVAWISNSDLDLVKGGASFRRRYLDFLGVQSLPGYLKSLRSYERALRSRNALLKEGRPWQEISAFDAPLCEAGDQLLSARILLCKDLAPRVSAAYQEISDSQESLEICYKSGAETPMQAALDGARDDDSRLRVTTRGPHRDDLLLMLNGKPASIFASEGQQRSSALGLKLAQSLQLAEGCGQSPLYLIDDVFGELDARRRHNLLSALPSKAQKLITTTSLGWLSESPWPARIFELSQGKLRNAE